MEPLELMGFNDFHLGGILSQGGAAASTFFLQTGPLLSA